MIDKIKYFAKLSGIAMWSLVKIFALGYFSAVLSFVTGLIILLVNQTLVGSPHGGGELTIVLLFVTAPVQWILLALILISCYFIFTFASGYAVKKVINRIVKDKSESVLYPALEKVLAKLSAGNPDSLARKGVDYSMVKLRLIHTVKTETDNKWVKRALTYGFKKLQLADVDFSQEGIDANEIIKLKTIDALKSVSEPGKTFFWCIIGFHWVAVLVIAVMS